MRSADARRFARVVAVLAVVVSVSAQQNTSAEPDAEFIALLTAAQESFTDRNWDRGTAHYQKLLTAARTRGADLWQGRALLGLGRIANQTARYDDARRHGREALAIFERLNAASDIGDANTTLAIAASSVNDAGTAKMHYGARGRTHTARRAMSARASGRASDCSAITWTEADTLDTFGELQAEAHALGDKELEGQILHAWGDLLHNRSLYKPAIEKLEAAAALFQETKSLHRPRDDLQQPGALVPGARATGGCARVPTEGAEDSRDGQHAPPADSEPQRRRRRLSGAGQGRSGSRLLRARARGRGAHRCVQATSTSSRPTWADS